MPELPASVKFAKTQKWSQKQMTSLWQQHVLVWFTCVTWLPALQVCVRGKRLFWCSDCEIVVLFGGRWGTNKDMYYFLFCILEFLSRFFLWQILVPSCLPLNFWCCVSIHNSYTDVNSEIVHILGLCVRSTIFFFASVLQFGCQGKQLIIYLTKVNQS